jgi:hypothetical protein
MNDVWSIYELMRLSCTEMYRCFMAICFPSSKVAAVKRTLGKRRPTHLVVDGKNDLEQLSILTRLNPGIGFLSQEAPKIDVGAATVSRRRDALEITLRN